MKRRTFLSSIATAVAGSALPSSESTLIAEAPHPSDARSTHRFIHPGILHDKSDLQFIKTKVLAGQAPWKTVWDAMLTKPESSLEFNPQPRAHVFRGSYGAGQAGVNELNTSVDAAQSHVLQWIVTGRVEHARKCAEILDAWATTLCDFSGNDAMLLGGWTGGALANSAEILRATFPDWQHESIARFKRMLRTVYLPLLGNYFPEANGNWDAAIMHSLIAIAVFCEDSLLLENVLNHYRVGNGNGGITRYVYPNGQCEETTRDQAHTQLGLGYFALTARIAHKQGIDLFYEADNRLALGFEYTSRFMLGETMPVFGTASEQVRGRFDDFYEVALQQYRYEKGIAMPFTERAATKARDRSGRGVLLFYRGEGVKETAVAPTSSPVARQAGAQKVERASPVNAKPVAPGQSIQEALDDAAKVAGSVIYLAPGLHTLEAPLRISSGTALTGAGRATIIYMQPKAQGAVITNATPDVHDVVIRDFVIEGALESKPSRDPNQDARPRRSQMAPWRGGILLQSDGLTHIKNIRLESLTIVHCTSSAVDIFGAENVQVIDCDFSASGGAVNPGAGQHSNLRLSRSHAVTVEGTRLADSLCGSGALILLCDTVNFLKCELARNAQDGISILESSGVEVRSCLIEGNEGFAFGYDGEALTLSAASQTNNVVRNQARYSNPILRA